MVDFNDKLGTFKFIDLYLYDLTLLCFVVSFTLITGLAVGSRWWQIIDGSIPRMFSTNHANTSLLAYKKLVNSYFSRSISFEPIMAFCSGLSGSRLIYMVFSLAFDFSVLSSWGVKI